MSTQTTQAPVARVVSRRVLRLVSIVLSAVWADFFYSEAKQATTSQLDPISSDEEFGVQGDEDVSDASDTDAPNCPPEPAVHATKARNSPLSALNIHHFFTELESPTAAESQDRVQRACKLCIEAYGDEKDDVPRGVPNYLYAKSTEITKLRRHLRKQHPEEYNRAIEAQSNDGNDTRDATIPPFTEEGFLEHLARFVVASGQSVDIVESPYFRQMLMTLRGTLTDADFPDRDKMREAIRNLSARDPRSS